MVGVMLALGLVAGLVTTVAGMGGGMILVLALSAATGDPLFAIAVTTPALLVGNAHRFWLFRTHADWRRAAPFVAAAGPGALLGGALAVSVPPILLQLAMAAAAGLAVARYAGWLDVRVPGSALVPAGFGIGVASTAGGAGLLAGPMLLSAGFSGLAYITTMSLGALSMHLGRLLAFGAVGRLDAPLMVHAAVLAITIVAGNAIGREVRRRLGDRRMRLVEVGTAAGLVVLALVGLSRVAITG